MLKGIKLHNNASACVQKLVPAGNAWLNLTAADLPTAECIVAMDAYTTACEVSGSHLLPLWPWYVAMVSRTHTLYRRCLRISSRQRWTPMCWPERRCARRPGLSCS